jgi:adenylosuccinate synthase
MLLDVLSGFEELKICSHYEIRGVKTDWFPVDALELEHVTPIYETLPGWKETLDGVTRFEELPAAAKAYLARLEHHIGVPVKIVSVGAARHQTLVK